MVLFILIEKGEMGRYSIERCDTLNVSQARLAELSCVSVHMLSNLETGSENAASGFIVVSLPDLAFDGKNAFLDCPRTWAAIRANYSLCDSVEDGQRILLRRRTSPRPVICDRQISVPDVTLAERFVALFFRGGMHYTEIEVAPGALQRFRVNPLVLKEPVDRDLPLTIDGLATYLSGL